jgi:Fe2+ or Zn2+ uptake regulation protein
MSKMRQTKQKKLILAAIQDLDGHPHAEAVYLALKPDHPQLSLATVYRNLHEFSERGLLRKVEAPNQPVRFDKNVHPHAHGICLDCGEIVDIPLRHSGTFKSIIESVEEMEVTDFNLILYGYCKKCQRTPDCD